jgi:hypothetical protein
MIKRIPLPSRAIDLITNGQIAIDSINLLNSLAKAHLWIVPPTGSVAANTGKPVWQGDSGQELVLPIPLQFTRSIPDSTATVASVSATLNLLLAELRKNKQIPNG